MLMMMTMLRMRMVLQISRCVYVSSFYFLFFEGDLKKKKKNSYIGEGGGEKGLFLRFFLAFFFSVPFSI